MRKTTTTTTVEETCQYGYICCDSPLLIRIMEYVREDVRSDTELHMLAERMIEHSDECEVLTMKHYDKLVAASTDSPA
jgi:hypothetical protein